MIASDCGVVGSLSAEVQVFKTFRSFYFIYYKNNQKYLKNNANAQYLYIILLLSMLF